MGQSDTRPVDGKVRTSAVASAVAPVLSVRAMSKNYGGVAALTEASMSLLPGEVRGLLGKNGAGKSTLIKIISGVVRPSSGEMLIDGKKVEFASERQAFEAGIVTVHQELSVVPTMTAAENIVLGRWPRKWGKVGPIDHRSMEEGARRALASLGEDFPVDVPVGQLTLAQQQMTEIARALQMSPRVLLLDEPFSALSLGEVENLIERVRAIAAQGIAVVFVSHRMKEVGAIAKSFTILRDSRVVAEGQIANDDVEEVARLIVGEDASSAQKQSVARVLDGPVCLKVEGLRIPERGIDIDLQLRKGEVLGLAGLLGSGRSETLRALAGIEDREFGRLVVDGNDQTRWSQSQALKSGIYFVPEDRQAEGLVQTQSVEENIVLPTIARRPAKLRLDWSAFGTLAESIIRTMWIKVGGRSAPIGSLSGGNQQKVVIGKWLALGDVRVLLLDEPTRGVDIGARHQIHAVIKDLSQKGVAVVVVSSESEELLDLCDRIVLLHPGQGARPLPMEGLTDAKLTAFTLHGHQGNAA